VEAGGGTRGHSDVFICVAACTKDWRENVRDSDARLGEVGVRNNGLYAPGRA